MKSLEELENDVSTLDGQLADKRKERADLDADAAADDAVWFERVRTLEADIARLTTIRERASRRLDDARSAAHAEDMARENELARRANPYREPLIATAVESLLRVVSVLREHEKFEVECREAANRARRLAREVGRDYSAPTRPAAVPAVRAAVAMALRKDGAHDVGRLVEMATDCMVPNYAAAAGPSTVGAVAAAE